MARTAVAVPLALCAAALAALGGGGGALPFSPAPAQRARAATLARAAATTLELPGVAQDTSKQSYDAEGFQLSLVDNPDAVAEALRADVLRCEAELERLQAELELYALSLQLEVLEAEADQVMMAAAGQQALALPPRRLDPDAHFARSKRDLVIPVVIALSAAIGGWAGGPTEEQTDVFAELDPAATLPIMRKYSADSDQVLRHMRISAGLEREAANRIQWNKHLMDEITAWLTLYGSERVVSDRTSFAILKRLIEDVASSNLEEPLPRQQRAALLERVASCRELLALGL